MATRKTQQQYSLEKLENLKPILSQLNAEDLQMILAMKSDLKFSEDFSKNILMDDSHILAYTFGESVMHDIKFEVKLSVSKNFLLDIIKSLPSEVVTFEVAKNAPLKIITNAGALYLAPRVDESEEEEEKEEPQSPKVESPKADIASSNEEIVTIHEF